jgi:hypothetical protein
MKIKPFTLKSNQWLWERRRHLQLTAFLFQAVTAVCVFSLTWDKVMYGERKMQMICQPDYVYEVMRCTQN